MGWGNDDECLGLTSIQYDLIMLNLSEFSVIQGRIISVCDISHWPDAPGQ